MLNRLFVILLILNLILVSISIYLDLVSINKIENINIVTEGKEEETYFLEINNKDYYSTYELDDSGIIRLPEGIDDYLIYFHSDNCSACLMTNIYVDKYISLGYQAKVPIYFATYTNSPSLFENENIGINVTPTIIYFKSEQKKYFVYEGFEEITDLLNEIVNN